VGHVVRKVIIIDYSILVGELKGRIHLGDRHRWDDNIKMDVKYYRVSGLDSCSSGSRGELP
jgi:hypothetical protein